MYIVYCYTNKINGKKYVGITSRSINEREVQHIYESKAKDHPNYNLPFKCAIRKYGIENFNKEILDRVNTREEACELEKKYIKKFNTYYKYKNSNGYNATIGGEMIVHPKDRVVQIDKYSLEIVKIWDSISEAERCVGGSIYDVVNKYTRIAKDSYWFYEKYFIEIKDNYKNEIYSKNKYVCQIDLNHELIKIWTGSKEASEALGYSQGNIASCCNKDRRTANGYCWAFYDDFINNNYIRSKRNTFKSVIQSSINGEYIKEWESISSASRELNIQISDISSNCNGKNKSAGGYVWRFKEDNFEIKPYYSEKTSPVVKLDLNKNVIEYYKTMTEAANECGINYQNISRSVKNGMKAGGFYWKRVSHEEYYGI